MSPCLVTRTFTKVNRQYGQVMVGTDMAMVASLSLKGSACGGLSERRGGTSRTGDPPPLGESGQPRSVTVVLG